MTNELQRLNELREAVQRLNNRVQDLPTFFEDSSSEIFRQLLSESTAELADRQRELETLTVEVTNELHSKLTDPTVIRVLLLRHVKGMKFDSIARHVGCSSRWARKLYRHGLETLSADQ